MDDEGLLGEQGEELRPEDPGKVSQNIHYDDAGGREFDAPFPLQADKKGHDHRKHRQEEFIDDSGESAREGNHCVQ